MRNGYEAVTAVIEREDDGYVSLCPELDIASQGGTVEEARNNLIEAIELFFEIADPSEIAARLKSEVFISPSFDNHSCRDRSSRLEGY